MIETNELTMNVRIKECFDFLYQHQRDLTSGQLEFVNGLKKHFDKNKTLSDKQAKILFEMVKYMKKDNEVRL